MAKLKSTYTDNLPVQINPSHRAHPYLVSSSGGRHRQAVIDGSESAKHPDPHRSEGRRIRQAFIAPPGHSLVAADYSQIELRIMAHLSGDASLLRAFAEDRDVHQATAAEVFSTPLDQVSADQRRSAKAINFGLMYGMSAFGLGTSIGHRPRRCPEIHGPLF